VQYVAPIPEKRAATSTRVTAGARVLSSSKGYETLHAKEEKKKKEKEEQERKKKERLEKKKKETKSLKEKLKKGQGKLQRSQRKL